MQKLHRHCGYFTATVDHVVYGKCCYCVEITLADDVVYGKCCYCVEITLADTKNTALIVGVK